MSPTENILGYRVTTAPAAVCIARILQWIAVGERGRYLVCANPHSLEVARGDGIFSEALRQADLVVPDGIGVVLASRLLGGEIRERITGSDIFLGLNGALNEQKRGSVFFLGASEATLACMVEKMRMDFPGLTVAGVYAPPFKAQFSASDNEAMLAAVNRARPHVLWVGMTAPKQEKWIHQNREKLNVPFIGAVGAVFDFYTGKVKRSHPVFQKAGLEWLLRLVQEPRRLWRRNFVSNPLFVLHVIKEHLRSSLKDVTERWRPMT
jgi:N-acetylglucosaminyldiphosphoundecaprenol N-acetyl-beta-D-mannosaminyltransferase